MKFNLFYIFLFAVLAGCSPTSNTDSPYAPGGEFYVTPGTFVGTWTIKSVTTPCTAIISKTDSVLLGSITNDSTKEVLTIIGRHSYLPDVQAKHIYSIRDSSSSIRDTDYVDIFNFSDDGNALNFLAYRDTSYKKNISLSIVCRRE